MGSGHGQLEMDPDFVAELHRQSREFHLRRRASASTDPNIPPNLPTPESKPTNAYSSGIFHGWSDANLNQPDSAFASAKFRSDFHPTTIPTYEAPFWLEGELIPPSVVADPFADCAIRLTRGWERSGRTIDILPVRFYSDMTKLGCTYIPNETLSEVYWSSKAAPKLLRWVWQAGRMWQNLCRRVRGSQEAGSR